MDGREYEVPVERLRTRLNPDDLGFETTADVPPIEGVLGQDRAMAALEFGLQVGTDTYHVYAAGPAGTGKMTAIRTTLERVKAERPTPPDWCYIHDFDEADEPDALSLPAGRGQQLSHDMDSFIKEAGEAILRVFDSEEYFHRKEDMLRPFRDRREEISRQLKEEARQQGFEVGITSSGIDVIPLSDGRPLPIEELDRLPDEERRALQEKRERLKEEAWIALRRMRAIDREAEERAEEMDQEAAHLAIEPLMHDLREKYTDLPRVIDYLARVEEDIPKHLSAFLRPEANGREAAMAAQAREDQLNRYRVNVFIDNAQTHGAPVVIEYLPTYYNLFGRMDYRSRMGSMVTDHTMIKAGAIQRANGGFLVLHAHDAMSSPQVWETLRNTLLSGESRIENLGEQRSPVPAARIRPEPIPIRVKVVLVGTFSLYYKLNASDEDFTRLFGVRADFDVEMDRTVEHTIEYARFISSLAHKAQLKPFHKSAVARIIDFASRVAGNQQRLSAQFLEIKRVAREADFWATRKGNSIVMADDVEKAIAERDYRVSLLEDKLRQAILEQTVRVATDGMAPAQVNGLSVIDLGDHTFGRPARITARTSLGTQGVVNIERETALSGPIHSKGVLILSGYLAGKYAQDKPLALSASLTFEQTYNEVEGDSASSAELYSLLSSLSGLPLAQGIAVTGAINQLGQVQAIGGVNDKIEGFFRICRERGLTGNQGVIIPQDNVRNLMLRDEVVQAIRDGAFHIWAVESVDQGMKLLTGVPAGERKKNGAYPKGTIHYLVDQQLREFADRLREFSPIGGGGLQQTARPGRRVAAQQWRSKE